MATLFTGYKLHLVHNENQLSGALLANVEALASGDEWVNETECPDPYDVKDHQLSFTSKEGIFSSNVSGEITIWGKKFALGGGNANMEVTVTYEIGNCDKYSKGNCCPNSRNGEVNIINTVFN